MTDAQLQQQHFPKAIQHRLSENRQASLMPDAILGGIDGCVTTFAIISGSMGAGFVSSVALILGFSNLFADAFSMAVSNYEARQTEIGFESSIRATEQKHINEIPEGEREELRQIFRNKGFSGNVLEQIVFTISADPTVWIDTMLTEEYGLQKQTTKPLQSALATFSSFLVVGSLPLIPFLFTQLDSNMQFSLSVVAAVFAFLGIGLLKGKACGIPGIRTGFKTLLIGSAAAMIAFGTGYGLNSYL